MTVFEDCSVVVDLKNVPFKEKRKLMSAILDNGGNISYVINQKCSFVVASSLDSLSCNRQRCIQKHQTPVVDLQYVWSCVEQGHLLPVNEHVLQPRSPACSAGLPPRPAAQPELPVRKEDADQADNRMDKENKRDIPEFPSHFQVAKYSIFVKADSQTWSVVELQSARGEGGQQYRIVTSVTHEAAVFHDKQERSCSSEEALEVYVKFSTELQAQGFTRTNTLPPEAEGLASHSLQQLLLEERLNCSQIPQDVGIFVELVWTEALGSLSNLLTIPVTSVSLNDVSRVEGLLLQVQKCESESAVQSLLQEVNTLLPLATTEPDSRAKLVSQRLDLCQLIRDILNVSEATLGNPSPSSLGKYRALRCSIEQVPTESQEFQSVCKLLQDRPAQIHQVLRVSRAAELHMFREELGNVKPLLHSTDPSSFVGILSRGLLLPKVGVEQHGIDRTDVGNLGSGIYFSDSLSTSVKYSRPSAGDGSRLLLVCDVALGQCKDLYERDPSLSCAPDGHGSVHGVRRTQRTHSQFEDDEYVVYNTDQVTLKYVVQYFLTEDQVKCFEPHVDTSVDCIPSVMTSDLLSSADLLGLEGVKNPLEDVTPGLLDSTGSTLPLDAVHVRCKLMDLLCQVIIFQVYTNKSEVPIEAKYVFPLEETAAVCGFEAFINGKHVIGKVKEKEQARKEYKQAIEKGHGAYLMDQEAPDVFTISVGNLPAGATVLIKVTYITELVVRAGTVLFSLPASVAPWQQSAALNQRTQTSVEKVGMNELRPQGEFSLHMSIEMPYEIRGLDCSHRINTKRTECKAVVMTLPDQGLGVDGFQLSFSLSQIHMPRMWVEKHPEKDSEACMLVFYPDFGSGGERSSGAAEVIIAIDTSASMRGEPVLNARRLALKALHTLDRSLRVNILSFGTDYKEAFPTPRVLEEVLEPAKKFIMSSAAVGGSTELWKPLRSLNLLPPTRGLRNVLLFSDGHVQNQPQTLQMVRENGKHTRLFTCGLSPAANRHMLRTLAQAGGGVYEFFDTKKKHTWAEKVSSQVRCIASPGCRSVSVKWQRFNPTAPPPVQAPSLLNALFSNRHTLVYGFVPHCTQATLFGDLSGQEIQTMVSTTELQKTKGTFLHKLTARAVIQDYEDGALGTSEAEHEGRKAALKSYIIELSKEFSILSQFTSFVAIEERDQQQTDPGFTSIPELISEEDVDVLSYMGWSEEQESSCREMGSGFAEEFLADYMDCAADVSSVFCYSDGTSIITSPERLCSADLEYDDVEMDYYSALHPSPPPVVPAFRSAVHPPPPPVLPKFGSTLHPPPPPVVPEFGSTLHPPPPPVVPEFGSTLHPPPPPVVPEFGSTLHPPPPPVVPEFGSTLHPPPPPVVPQLFGSTLHLPPPPVLPKFGSALHPPPPPVVPKFGSALHPSFPPVAQALQGLSPLRAQAFSSRSVFLPTCFVPQSYAHSSAHDIADAAKPSPVSPEAPMDKVSFFADCNTGFSFSQKPFKATTVPRDDPVPHSSQVCFGAPKASPGASSFFSSALIPAAMDLSLSHPPPPESLALSIEKSASSPVGDTAPLSTAHHAEVYEEAQCTKSASVRRDRGAIRIRAFPLSTSMALPLAAPQAPILAAPQFPILAAPQFPILAAPQAPLLAASQAPPPPASQAPPLPASQAPPLPASLAAPLPDSLAPPLLAPHAAPCPPMAPPPIAAADVITMESSSGANQCAGGAQMGPKHFSPKRKMPAPMHMKPAVYASKKRLHHRMNWKELFDLQHQDGYWEFTGELGKFLGLDVHYFTDTFLKEKGICSLGVKAHTAILRLVATLLVLQVMRVMKAAGAEYIHSLFHLRDAPEPRPAHWGALDRAVSWARQTDREYPCVCSRLEFGWDWESSTRQLLGLDAPPPYSPLLPVLQRSKGLAVL